MAKYLIESAMIPQNQTVSEGNYLRFVANAATGVRLIPPIRRALMTYWQAIFNVEWHNMVNGGAYPRAVRELG